MIKNLRYLCTFLLLWVAGVGLAQDAQSVARIGIVEYATLQAAFDAATDGATIQVVKAGEYAIPAITKNLTIEGDVDGVVVKHEENSAITTIASGKTATFKNITFNLGTLEKHTAHGFGTLSGSNGLLVMDGCTINGALNLFGESTFTSCTFNANGIYNIWAVNDNATFTGCTFNNTNRAVNVYDQKKGSTTKNVSFSGCTFKGSEKKKAAINIHHNPDGPAAKYAVSITNCTTSGTWASTVEETGEPDGSTICYSPLWMISDIVNWEDGDITVTVDGKPQDVSKFSPVAKIGDTKYTSLEAAVAAAEDDATIKVIKAGEYAIPAITKNLTIEGAVEGVAVKHEENSAITTIASGKTATFKNITFNLGTLEKHTAHGFGTLSGSNGALKMDECTINGALNLFGESTFTDCKFNAEGIYNIWAVNDNATFTGCTFTNTNRAVNVYAQKKGSTTKNVSFSGCTFKGSEKKKAAINIHHNPDGPAAKYAVSITNCTTSGTWASTVEETGEPDGSTICYSPLWMISDIVNWEDGDITVTMNGEPQDVSKFSPVAKIGDTKYTSLEAAVNAAAEGDEILILKDFTLTTVTTSPNNKYNVNVNKSVTINGDGHTITSSEGKRALALTGDGNNITLKNLTVVNNKSDWCVGILNNPKVTLDATTIDGSGYEGGYNQPLTIGGEGEGGVKLYVTNGSVIKTNNEGTAHYSIIVWRPSEITVTDSKLIGWAGIYLKPAAAGSIVKIEGSEIVSKGIAGFNNKNNFAAIVSEGNDIEIEIKDTKINTTPAEDTYESLFVITGSNNVVKILGTTKYETTDMTLGAVTSNPSALFNNKVYFDDETKAAFAKYFTAEDGPTISNEKESPINLYPLVYAPEVYYYWEVQGGYAGVYTNFAYPFEKTEEFILGDGEYIKLMKDITLDHNIVNPLASGTINLLLDNYTITKGDYSLQLKEGQTIKTDKQTDIFSAVDAGYKVVETAVEGGYTYTVVAKEYVAQIGEGENVVKYETLTEAVEAAGTEATTIKMIADETLTANVVIGGTYGSSTNQTTAINPQNITLDLNGKNITGDKTIYLAGGSLNITGEGTIENTGTGAAPVGIRYQTLANPDLDYTSKRTLTIGENVTLKGKVYGLNIFGTNNASVANNIEANVNGKLEGILFVLGNLKNDDNNIVITVNGSVDASEMQSGAEDIKTGIALNGNAKLVVNDGASVTGETGIEVRAGELSMNGGTITATAEEYSYAANNSGTTIKGAAIAVAPYDKTKDVKVTVSGGTLSGGKLIAVVDVQNNLEKVTVTAKDDFVDGADETVIPEGYKWVSSEGVSTLTPCDYVAQIGEGDAAVKYESLADAVAAVTADGTETTITMIANEMINVVGSAITIPANKNVVIDLNGFQVVGTAEGGSTSALITNKGTLTIKDSSDTNKDGTGTGKLISGATTTWIYDGGDDYSGSYASNTITNSGTLTIESGYVENLSTGSATYAVDNNSSGGNAILNMNGGLLKAHSVAVRQFANSTTLKNEVNIAGGTVTAGKSGIWIQLPGSDATKAMKATLNVTGGTLTGEYAFYDYTYGNSFDATQYNLSGGTFNGGIFSYGANINITEGTYNGDVAIKQAKPSEVTVSGGKFGGDVYTYGANASEGFITGGVFASTTYEYEGNTYNCGWLSMLADGYVPGQNTDPETMEAYPYAVRQANYICAIGETKYETLQDAINACEAGTETTIKLLDNVTDGAGFAIPDGVTNKNIIIDFDRKSYNVTKDAVGSSDTKTQAMHFYSGNTLTLKNGTITSAATSDENKLKMMMQNYCDLTLDGMTIDCSNVNGGTYPDYSGTAYEYWSFKSVPVFNFNTGNATIKNTTVTFRDGDNVGLCVDGGTVALGEGVVVNGPVSAVTGTLTITDGKYSGAVTADQATVQISGGIFTKKPADEYCAQGYVVTDNTDEATMGQYPFTVKTKEAAGIYELDDVKDQNAYPYPEGATATKVTYKRTFTEGNKDKYQSWMVPFDYTITSEDLNNFKFYKINFIAPSKTGGVVQDNTKVYIFIEPLKAGDVLRGNKPYVIKPNKVLEKYVFTTEGESVKLYPETTTELIDPISTTAFIYKFFGTFEHKDFVDKNQVLFMYSGQIWWNGDGSYLRTYRWYIKPEAKGDYAKPNIFIVEGDDDTDGISNARLIYDEIEGIYTLGGIKVEHPVKGVNIIKYTDGRTKKINVK